MTQSSNIYLALRWLKAVHFRERSGFERAPQCELSRDHLRVRKITREIKVCKNQNEQNFVCAMFSKLFALSGIFTVENIHPSGNFEGKTFL